MVVGGVGGVGEVGGCLLQFYALNLTLTFDEALNSSRKHAYLPHFYIVKLGFAGVTIIFSYFCSQI